MNRLKELRLNAGISQAALAKAAETTQRNISYWESGTIELNLYAAIRLAQIFQVDVEYLAGYSDELGIKPDVNLHTAAPMSNSSYSSDERELIKKYRALPDKLKKMIRDNLEVYSESNELLPKKGKKA